MMFEKVIKFNNILYTILVTDKYELLFSAKSKLNLETTESIKTEYPIAAMRKIFKEIESYIFDNAPPFLIFNVYDKKRAAIYRRVCKKLIEILPYSLNEHEGKFLLTRLRVPSHK